MSEEKIIVNGKEVSEEEFQKLKEQENSKQIRIVEVGKNQYKTRLFD